MRLDSSSLQRNHKLDSSLLIWRKAVVISWRSLQTTVLFLRKSILISPVDHRRIEYVHAQSRLFYEHPWSNANSDSPFDNNGSAHKKGRMMRPYIVMLFLLVTYFTHELNAHESQRLFFIITVEIFFCSPDFIVPACEIIADNDGKFYPSDHLPFFSTIILFSVNKWFSKTPWKAVWTN